MCGVMTAYYVSDIQLLIGQSSSEEERKKRKRMERISSAGRRRGFKTDTDV